MNQIDQYAEKFARINPDDINAIEKQVLELVNAGKLSEAIELYNKSGIITQAREKLSQKTKAEEDIDKLAETMYRYADLCALTGGMENEKKANDAYKFVAEALPDRFTYVFKYALQKIGLEDSDTMEWLDKCQKLSFDEKSLVHVSKAWAGISISIAPSKTSPCFASITASAILETISLTALMASSLPGIT